MIYRLENTLYNLLNQEHYTDLEREKLKFGIQIILSESIKLMIVYLTAFLLDCIGPTLITHLTFFFLRQVCFGYHFKNLYVCIGWSLMTLPLATYLLAERVIDLSSMALYITFFVLWLWVYILAPRGTENHPIISEQHQGYLRGKIIIRLLLLVLIFIFIPIDIKIFITYGLLIETVMLNLQILKERLK